MMRIVKRVSVVATICVLGMRCFSSVVRGTGSDVWLWTAHMTEDRMAWNEKFTESYHSIRVVQYVSSSRPSDPSR